MNKLQINTERERGQFFYNNYAWERVTGTQNIKFKIYR